MDKKYRFSYLLITLLIIFLAAFSVQALSTQPESTNDSETLSVDQAFKISVKEINNGLATLSFDIAPDYLLYQEHFQFQSLSNEKLKDSEIKLPTPTIKKDQYLGELKVYKKHMDITVPLSVVGEKSGFRIQYQGCSQGFCYPPVYKQIMIGKDGTVDIQNISAETFQESPQIAAAQIAKTGAKTTGNSLSKSEKSHTLTVENSKEQAADAIIPAANASTKAKSQAASHDPVESDTDRIANLFQDKALPFTLLAFLGLGIMLACTPCVLPMVPILANILVGQDQPLTRKRSVYLASLYVLSVSLCYAGAGVAAGLLGSHLQTTLQQPIFLVGLSFLLLLFALNQFNMLHVQLPSIFSNALHQLEQKQKHGSAVGAVAMGAISALMVSPCVTPALVGALTYIGHTGNALLGGAALFSLALGMGLPLLIVACVGSHLLPKAGPWMRHIKSFTGILLIVLAGSILLRAVPITGVERQAALNTPFVAVHDKDELNKALATARSQKKPVVLDVYADWCISCRQMDKEVFENHDVLKRLSSVQLLRLDLTKQTSGSEQLQKELGIIGPPMVLFFGPDGREAKAYRIAGKSETNAFIEKLNRFLEQANVGSK